MKEFVQIRLYLDTIRNLKAVQIKYQLQNRIVKKWKAAVSRAAVQKLPVPEHCRIHIAIPELDEADEYVTRFHSDTLLHGEVELLYEKHALLWEVPEASHLWNYNLQYLEYLIPLAVQYNKSRDMRYLEKWRGIICSWLKDGSMAADAFEPYTISLRIPNLLICLELLGSDAVSGLENGIYASVYQQYKYLLYNQELALLANHYFENLKTIVLCSVVFCEQDVYQKYVRLFMEQIHEQILPDGMHFERSIMYHKIILEDILRIYVALRNSGHRADAKKLVATVRIMADVLYGLESGFERTPLFNDAGDNISKGAGQLLLAAKKYCGWQRGCARAIYPCAGYYRLDNGSSAVLFDCGDIGPKYMSGHSHNDCLSFELAVEGKSLFTNSGTGQYQGSKRQFFRSTSAHNTVMIDDREQSELWGEHRAGRRLRDIRAFVGKTEAAGRFYSYEGDFFCRRMSWTGNGLQITDYIRSCKKGICTARQFFHLAPGYRYQRKGHVIAVLGQSGIVAEVTVPRFMDIRIHTDGEITAYAGEFGKYEKKEVLEIYTQFEGSVRLYAVIKIIERKRGHTIGKRNRAGVYRSSDGLDAGSTWREGNRN